MSIITRILDYFAPEPGAGIGRENKVKNAAVAHIIWEDAMKKPLKTSYRIWPHSRTEVEANYDLPSRFVTFTE